MKRKERLLQTEGEKASSIMELQLEREQLQLKADLLETQSKVSDLSLQLEQAKSNLKLDVSKVLELTSELASYKEGEKMLKALQKELF